MNYFKAIGFGILIWGIAFVVASVFVSLKIQNALLMQGVTTLAVLGAAFFLAKNLGVSDKKEMLKYSGSWVVISLILDGLLADNRWIYRPGVFQTMGYLGKLLLLLLVPLLAVKKGAKE